MNLSVKTTLLILRSARPVLWLPILVNVEALSLTLSHSPASGLLLGASLCCLAAYGFLINDIWDLPVDRENRAGKLEYATNGELRGAAIFAAIFLALGLCLGAILGLQAFLAMLMVGVALAAYTFLVRPKLLLANLLAAALASTPLWLPNLIFHQSPDFSQWVIILVSTLILMGREVIFDVTDMAGDMRAKRRTLPGVLGGRIATRIAVVWQLSGCLLLVIWCAARTASIQPGMQLLMWSVVLIFSLLLVPVNWTMFSDPERPGAVRDFTLRTRLAMLLIPVIMLVLLIKP